MKRSPKAVGWDVSKSLPSIAAVLMCGKVVCYGVIFEEQQRVELRCRCAHGGKIWARLVGDEETDRNSCRRAVRQRKAILWAVR